MIVLSVSLLFIFFEFLIIMYAYDVFNLDEEFFVLVSLVLWLCVFVFNFLKDSLEFIQNYILLDAFEIFFFHDRRTMLSFFFFLQCTKLLKLYVSLDNFFNLFSAFLPKAICISKLSIYNQHIIACIYGSISTFSWFFNAYENNFIRMFNLMNLTHIHFAKKLTFDLYAKSNLNMLNADIFSKSLKSSKSLRNFKNSVKNVKTHSALFRDDSSTLFLSRIFIPQAKTKFKNLLANVEYLEHHLNALRFFYCLNSLGTSSLRYNKLSLTTLFKFFEASDYFEQVKLTHAILSELNITPFDFGKRSSFTGFDLLINRKSVLPVLLFADSRLALFINSTVVDVKSLFFKNYKLRISF